MLSIHFYRYQMPGEKRWQKTRHRMDAEFAREWFAMFHPDATYEPIADSAVDVGSGYEIGPNNHGGWRDPKKNYFFWVVSRSYSGMPTYSDPSIDRC